MQRPFIQPIEVDVRLMQNLDLRIANLRLAAFCRVFSCPGAAIGLINLLGAKLWEVLRMTAHR